MSSSRYDFDYTKYRQQLLSILQAIDEANYITWPKLRTLLHKNASPNGIFSKNQLILALEGFQKELDGQLLSTDFSWLNSDTLRSKIQMKPTRTVSGVTPVTVLTKPFPCPGQCIFCPNDTRMPKSYLADEPGAQRAERNGFDPYLQTFGRLLALKNIGHEVDKVELIVLGGTWSFYPEPYQIWFVQRMFQAVNDFGDGLEDEYQTLLIQIGDPNYRSKFKNTDIIRNVHSTSKNSTWGQGKASQTYNQIVSANLKLEAKTEYVQSQKATWEQLFFQHKRNENAVCKVSGLVIETRPDNINEQEVIRIRRLGCTKTQIGFQSLNDEVLAKNHRGHDVAATRKAVWLLRQAGFKIHAHWMANLYGSTPKADIDDYHSMFSDPDFRPDELKVYPCSLIETAELMDYYEAGLWKPYNHEDLLAVVSTVIADTPEYCRLTRIIRDIPSTDIVVGNKKTNFREYAEAELKRMNIKPVEIRSREVKNKQITRTDLTLQTTPYTSSFGQELFLQFVTSQNHIAGFLRLALPVGESAHLAVDPHYQHPFIPELSGCAIIREIHVYGKLVQVGEKEQGRAQHLGLGKELIEYACEIAKEHGFEKVAVISSIGTREYYRKRGFTDGELYQIKSL